MLRILDGAIIASSLGLARVASADPAPADARLAEFQQANAAIRSALSRADAPPSLKDPAYAKQVTAAFDLQLIDTLKDQPYSAVQPLCEAAERTGTAYANWGFKAADVAGLDARAATARTLTAHAQNNDRFQDELSAGRRFAIACMALQAEKLDVGVRSLKLDQLTPADRDALAKIQTGLVQMVENAALFVFLPIRPGNREAALDTLADHIGPVAAAMSKSSRDKAAKTVDVVLASPALSKAGRERLAAVRRSLDQVECNALCRLS